MKESLTIKDNRTGKEYEIPIEKGTIRVTDLKQIKTSPEDYGLMGYDPAYLNTAICRSAITFLDGEKGILRYRGYPIEQLAEKSQYLETAYLLVNGNLPTEAQLKNWKSNIRKNSVLGDGVKHLISGFPRDAHPMRILIGAIAGAATFYPDSLNIDDADSRELQTYRLIGQMITLAAYAYRHTQGLPYVDPDADLRYSGNFLSMLFKNTKHQFDQNPVLVGALDLLFVLHADHEQSCSTSSMRNVGSSRVDPFAAIAAATAALYGPLHGGANEAVLHMLNKISSKQNVPKFIKEVEAGKAKLMGFGHRVYKNYDPRARIIKKMADQVFQVTGKNPLLDIALELERIALEDDYFVSRKLYPNVDFYSGLIYQSMGLPEAMFPVLFAIGRTAGWVAQWREMITDKEQKISRPRQIYIGSDKRDYVSIEKR